MHLILLQAVVLFVAALIPQGAVIAPPVRKPLPLHAAIRDKNFYLLSFFEMNPDVRHALSSDTALIRISSERQQRLTQALRSCGQAPDCLIQSLLWKDEDIEAVSSELDNLFKTNERLRKILSEELQKRGTYVLYEQQGMEDALLHAWALCAHGINQVLTVYGEGTSPRYPKIDSAAFDVHSDDFRRSVFTLVGKVNEKKSHLFFESSLDASLQLLTLNHRDESGRFEPMEKAINKAAMQAIPAIRWGTYPYSVIVVPGEGPQDSETALSEIGRQRTALAAEAYRAGKAPFILVSGGFVHPSQTRFAEAIEMKKYLMFNEHVPAQAILVDPHARHTTTNMRNAAREIYRYGIPMDKPALVVSDPLQIKYIQGQPLAARCQHELGYVPYQIVTRPSDTSLVFSPNVESLQQNPLDPLDP
jgi:hypothetical protein